MKKYLFIAIGLGIFISPAFSHAMGAPTLIYHLNNSYVDSSINGFTTGVYSSGTAGAYYYDTGKLGEAGFYYNDSQALSTAHGTPAGDFTLAVWFNASTTPTGSQQILAGQDSESYDNGTYVLKLFTDGKVWGTYMDDLNTSGAQITVSSTAGGYFDGQWHLAVLLSDGTSLKLYVDNVLQDSRVVSWGTYSYTSPFEIGAYNYPFSTGYPFRGLIDEVVYWDETLSSGDLDTIWNSGNGCEVNAAGTSCSGPYTWAPTISILNPPSVVTSTPDFRNWKVQFNVATSSLMLWQITMHYGTTTAASDWTNTFPPYYGGSQSTAGFLDVPIIMQKGVTLTTGTYYAYAELALVDAAACPNWSPCAPTIVTSTLAAFTIDPSHVQQPSDYTTSTSPSALNAAAQTIRDSQYKNNPENYFGISSSTPTSSITLATGACKAPADWTDIGGGLTYAGCAIMNYAFVPSTTTLRDFEATLQNIQGAQPFNYFFNANQQIGIQIGAATTTAVGWEIPYIASDGVATDTLELMPAQASAVPFLGSTGFINEFWNLLLAFIILLLIGVLFVVGQFFIELI